MIAGQSENNPGSIGRHRTTRYVYIAPTGRVHAPARRSRRRPRPEGGGGEEEEEEEEDEDEDAEEREG
jgi:hypothetical protein